MDTDPGEVERIISLCYKHVENIQTALIHYKTGNRAQRQINDFKQRLSENKTQLMTLSRGLCEIVTLDSLLNQFAWDTMKNFQNIKKKYKFDDVVYRSSISAVVKPIISSILTETKFTADTERIQNRRKDLLKEMINFQCEDTTESAENTDDEIDVCSIFEEATQPFQQPIYLEPEPQRVTNRLFNYSREAYHIFSLLFEALTLFGNKLVTGFDFTVNVYHMMNIFEIFEILIEALQTALKNLQTDRKAGVNFAVCNDSRWIIETLGTFRKLLSSNLERLTTESPFILFRTKLRSLFILLSALIGSLTIATKS